MDFIEKKVHELYWKEDVNCARTTLICLSELLDVKLAPQTLHSAIGLHGAGGFCAQCGLVEGGLMFIGIYFTQLKKDEETVVSLCYKYAEAFTERFQSLRCCDLRPNGFNPDDPPHLCEKLTCESIAFTYGFIRNQVQKYRENA